MQHAFWIRNGPHAPETVVDLAVAAEEGGWDGVFVSDAVLEAHSDPLTLLAAIAAVTDTILLGTWVVPLPARDVVAVARSAAVVDALSGGRLLLGLGLGNAVEHDALGVPRARLGARYDAGVEVLRTLLAGGTVTRHDEWFDLDEVALNVAPVRDGGPPLALAVQSDAQAPVRRAAAHGGLMPSVPDADPATLRRHVTRYRELGGEGPVVAMGHASFGEEWDATVRDLAVDWLLTCDGLDAAAVRQGPA